MGDTVDAYVELQVNDIKDTSKVIYGSLNPAWKQQFNMYYLIEKETCQRIRLANFKNDYKR